MDQLAAEGFCVEYEGECVPHRMRRLSDGIVRRLQTSLHRCREIMRRQLLGSVFHCAASKRRPKEARGDALFRITQAHGEGTEWCLACGTRDGGRQG